MNEVADFNAAKRSFEELKEEQRRVGNRLKSGGGGGTSDGMDPWQQTVETRLGDLRTDLRAVAVDVGVLKTDVATIKERLEHVATKAGVYGIVTAVGVMLGALTVFAPVLQHLLGVKP